MEKIQIASMQKNLELWKQSDLRDPSASDANNGKGEKLKWAFCGKVPILRKEKIF